MYKFVKKICCNINIHFVNNSLGTPGSRHKLEFILRNNGNPGNFNIRQEILLLCVFSYSKECCGTRTALFFQSRRHWNIMQSTILLKITQKFDAKINHFFFFKITLRPLCAFKMPHLQESFTSSEIKV
jgi:hypothetical protein